MSMEIQIAKIACATALGGLGIYYTKDIADNYFELKALSVMPDSYFAAQEKEAEMEVKMTEIRETEETKREHERLEHQKEKEEKDRAHQLAVMEKEKEYPDSYWLYKTEEVKTKTAAKAQAKKDETSLEKQKTIWNALSTGFDIFTRRYSW